MSIKIIMVACATFYIINLNKFWNLKGNRKVLPNNISEGIEDVIRKEEYD